jgi:uncharacterized delta-60 repeat protein
MRRIITATIIAGFCALMLFPQRTRAAAGDLDLTFNPGLVSTNASPVHAFAVQSDGRILMGGDFTVVDGVSRNHIARLNTDGSVDTTFIPGTGADAAVNVVAIQADGKILIGGNFLTINGTGRSRIARLNTDGSVDTTFNPGTGASNAVFAIAIQPDGRIVIGGSFSVYNGTTRNSIARLNADGSLDTTFTIGTGANNAVFAIAVQVDGHLVVGGQFTSFNGTTRNRVMRLNADGSLDATFNVGTAANNAVNALALQPDGRILMGGVFTNYNGTARNFIARLNTDGSLDTTLDPGTGPNSTVFSLVIQTDGRIVLGGFFTSYNGTARNRIVRINANGSLDSAFNPGTGAESTVQAVALQTDGRILLGGSFELYNGAQRISVARANADGSLDASLDAPTGTDGEANSIALQSDGKLVIGGEFGGLNGATRRRLGRINADGNLDSSFNPGTGVDGGVVAIALQTDGRILIGGFFTTFDGTARNRIARLNSDGSLDTTFNIGTGANSAVRAIAFQPDGRILIGGQFTTYNGTARNNLARLNADGSLDATFNVGTGGNNNVFAIGIQPDGNILIGGQFTTFNSTARNRIARLNSDGSLDTTFNPGTGADSFVQAFALQNDGRILIGGSFTNYNGTARNRIARLNSDGSLDASFSSGTGASAAVLSVALQSDGRIVIGGQFATFNALARSAIARLNADGSLDTSFDPGAGAVTNTVNIVLVQPDGQIIIGGDFSTYDGIPRFGLARIQPGDSITWNGSVSSDWNDPSNWTPALVPTNSDTVFIPAGSLPNVPVISANAVANSLTINAGQTLTINAGRSLTLIGLSNTGTIAGAGTLNLNGFSFSNNGIISVADVVAGGGAGFKNLSGTGSFVNNLITVTASANLDIVSDHQVNAVTANGSFRILSSGVTLTVTGAGTPLIGNLTLNGITNYNGGVPQTIANANHVHLIVSNPAGVSLNANVAVSGNLTLNGGNVLCGANTLTLSNSASTVSRTSGHVIGNFRKTFAAAGTKTFEVGTANGYSPVVVSATSGTFPANFTVRATQGPQPNITAFGQALARYWTLTATGVTADLTFSYLDPTDIPATANENGFVIFKYDGSFSMPGGSVNTAANTASISGVTLFSDWTLAQPTAPTAAPGTISGVVTTTDGTPLSGVVAELTGGPTIRRAITNSSGEYVFTGVATDNFYIVSPLRANYAFAPQERAFTLRANKADAVFTAMAVGPFSNPLETPEFFVRQQYLDFLGREPEQEGLDYWSAQTRACNGDAACIQARRIRVSDAFFYEREFQETGAYVYRLYKASFGSLPGAPNRANLTYEQFVPDRRQVIGGPQLNQSKLDFANAFVLRPAFVNIYGVMTNAQYVDALNAGAHNSLVAAQREAFVNSLNSGTETRGSVLRQIADNSVFSDREYNASFVLTEYFGYLRRDPDQGGYDFWLNQVNRRPIRDTEVQHAMVCSFITSAEYQQRFSAIVTHTNAECP